MVHRLAREHARLELEREIAELPALGGRECVRMAHQLGHPPPFLGGEHAEMPAREERELDDGDEFQERHTPDRAEHENEPTRIVGALALIAAPIYLNALMTHALLSSPPALALLPDAALVLDAQGQVVSASPPSAAMFGVDPTGRELTELIPDPARLWGSIAGVQRGGTVALVPLSGRRADGVPFALDVSVRVLADGRLLLVLRELDRNEPGTLDAAFDAMPLGMALFNTDGECVRVNGALCACRPS